MKGLCVLIVVGLIILTVGELLVLQQSKSSLNQETNEYAENTSEKYLNYYPEDYNESNNTNNIVENVQTNTEELAEKDIVSGDYFGYRVKTIQDDTIHFAKKKGYMDFTKDGITYTYSPTTKYITYVCADDSISKIIIPSKIGKYDIVGVDNLDLFNNTQDVTVVVEEGIEEIGSGFSYNLEGSNPWSLTIELPNSIKKVYDNLYNVNVINMPSKDKLNVYSLFTTIKLEDNLYLVQDFTENIWTDYKPAKENMDNLQKLLKDRINGYIDECKEYSANNANKTIIAYICISEGPGSNYYYYQGRFSNEDNEKDLSEAVVYYMRSKYPFTGNGGIFPRHDEDEEHSLYCPFYDKNVIASGAIYSFEYDKELNIISSFERLYPGEV